MTAAGSSTMAYKCADPELQLEVDLLILDCLIYEATKSVLAGRGSQQDRPVSDYGKAEHPLEAVESYLAMFRASHPRFAAPGDVHFRLRLLKFTTLFCNRLSRNTSTPALRDLTLLREDNRSRADVWVSKRQSHVEDLRQQFDLSLEVPLPAEKLSKYRSSTLDALGADAEEAEENFYGSEASVSLLDLLSCFMELTAARGELGGGFSITRRWMELAAQFMLQACAENYLIFGAGNGDVVKKAFAWGFVQPGAEAKVDLDVDGLFKQSDENGGEDAMDVDVDATEVPEWQSIKDEFSGTLLVGEGVDLIEHMERISREFPIADFENGIMNFLEAISKSIAAPVLVQVENGQLEGLSIDDTRAFREKVGLASC